MAYTRSLLCCKLADALFLLQSTQKTLHDLQKTLQMLNSLQMLAALPRDLQKPCVVSLASASSISLLRLLQAMQRLVQVMQNDAEAMQSSMVASASF